MTTSNAKRRRRNKNKKRKSVFVHKNVFKVTESSLREHDKFLYEWNSSI